MAYLLKRISAVPNSPMRIMVSDPVNGPMLNSGGTFYFAPAGQEGDAAEVSELVARTVMTDKGLAEHFSCTPALDTAETEAAAASNRTDSAAENTRPTESRRRRKSSDAGGAAGQ